LRRRALARPSRRAALQHNRHAGDVASATVLQSRQTAAAAKSLDFIGFTHAARMWHGGCSGERHNTRGNGAFAMIVLTTEAVSAVKNAMVRAGKIEAGLRIMVEAGGCAGYKYLIGLDAEPRADDVVVEAGDVKLFIDPDSQPLLSGLRIDFVESLEGSGFTFDNPNAASKCSCGKSFG
jgi:iron-sulfur cluster assembly protein